MSPPFVNTEVCENERWPEMIRAESGNVDRNGGITPKTDELAVASSLARFVYDGLTRPSGMAAPSSPPSDGRSHSSAGSGAGCPSPHLRRRREDSRTGV